MQGKKKTIPFSVSRNDSRTLFAQVSDGLREAIVSGYYAPGDVLPTSRELARLLGVSMIVAAPALKRLADEGLVEARPRRGTIVRDRNDKQWRGHVVLVGINKDDNYLQSVLAGSLRDRLMEEGYLFTQVHADWTHDRKMDFSSLDATLSRSVNLVIALYKVEPTFLYLFQKQIPFVAFAEMDAAPRGAIGFTKLDYNLAVDEFADECVRLGVKEVVEVNWYPTMCDLSPLKKHGIHVRRLKIKVDFANSPLAVLRRAGMEAFSQLVQTGRLLRGAVYFFGDDNIATGAIAALSYAGLRAPEDFRFATWANKDNELPYPRELSRMVLDPAGAGATVAQAVLQYLKIGVYPSNGVVGPKWISGETMGTLLPLSSTQNINTN